jgi:hypothetical protein
MSDVLLLVGVLLLATPLLLVSPFVYGPVAGAVFIAAAVLVERDT